MNTARHLQIEAFTAKVVAALTHEWERISVITGKIYGTDLDYGTRISCEQSVRHRLCKLMDKRMVDCQPRIIGGRLVKFYRRRTRFLPRGDTHADQT